MTCSPPRSPSTIYCLDDKIDAAIGSVLPFIKEAVLKIKAAEKSRAHRRLSIDLSPEAPEFELGTADSFQEQKAAGGTSRKPREPRRLSIDAKEWLQSQWEARWPQSNATEAEAASTQRLTPAQSRAQRFPKKNSNATETKTTAGPSTQGLTPAQSRAQRFPKKNSNATEAEAASTQGLTPAQSRAQRFPRKANYEPPTEADEDVAAAYNLHRARSDLDEFEAEIDVLRRVHSM